MVRGMLIAMLLCGVALLLAGCSSTSSSDVVLPEDGLGVRITEYVGDGHGGSKPQPFPLLGSPVLDDAVLPQATPTPLYYGASWLYQNVYPKAVNCFYLPPLTAPAKWAVVTMQPVHDKDADLYLLRGYGPYDAGVPCLGYSDRSPTAPGDVVRGPGYAPDWIAWPFGDTSGYPAAYVAAYGAVGGRAGPPYFRLEADIAPTLQINGLCLEGMLGAAQSHWYRFDTDVGHYYRVGLAAFSGDPDVYVYQKDSTHFVADCVGPKGGYAEFTATDTWAFARVYAYTPCNYAIRVLKPR